MAKRKGTGNGGDDIAVAAGEKPDGQTSPENQTSEAHHPAPEDTQSADGNGSARPWYSLMGTNRATSAPEILNSFATIGQARKWWQQSKQFVGRLYSDLSLVRSKQISLTELEVEGKKRGPRQKKNSAG